jgi:hypothetical protein
MIKVQLNGDDKILAVLAEIYSDEGIIISLDNEYKKYFMFGREIDQEIKAEEEIRLKIPFLSNIIDKINFIGNFSFPDYIPIGFKNIYFDDSCISCNEEFLALNYEIKDNENKFIDEIAFAKKIREIISNDDILLNILNLLYAYGTDWVNLYKILELIESANIDVVKKGWISKDNYRLFKHTANSFKAVGLDARHGKDEQEPPLKPMSIITARNLVKILIIKYIERQ